MISAQQRRLGGRWVTTGGQDGDGPTVVLLGGCGVPHALWAGVTEALAGHRVLWLDRPGMGGTPWPGRVPTLSEEVATLGELAAAEDAPVVLVGHSMAGPHAEAAARQYPQRVGGLVLVDSSVEWRVPVGAGRTGLWTRLAAGTRVVLGNRVVDANLHRLLRSPLRSGFAQRHGVTPEMAEEVLRMPGADAEAMTVAEFGGYTAQITELYAVRARHPWSGVPTVVLTAGRGSTSRWVGCQARLARLLDADHDVVDSGHNMMLDQPDAVAGAVRRVLDQLRR